MLGLVLANPAPAMPPDPPPAEPGTVLRILSPPGRQLSGRTPIETLTIDTEVARVTFYLDGEEVASKRLPPYNVKVTLASPPREQTVRAEAFDRKGRLLGLHEIVVNRTRTPLRVRITALEPSAGGEVLVRADLSLPEKAVLARFELYLNDELRTINRELPFEARLEVPSPGPEDFVRVVAVLADGREVEDVELLAAPGLSEEVDVNLVQLQALVSRRDGSPVSGLGRADFEIVERGERREIDRLYVASDVALSLGLVLDSSGSMEPVWDLARSAAEEFLSAVVTSRDRAFVVDFDTQLRLVQPLTGELDEIVAGLEGIEPEGATALYDSILYSLLQFEDEPGRRALVVLTDGYEAGSTSDPRRSVEFARLLGVPVYVVLLEVGERSAGAPGARLATRGLLEASPVGDLRLLTDPTGGRLIRISSASAIARAFAHIDAELRHQYVLTYYSDQPPDADERDAVSVRVPGRKDVTVRTVWALDQVN
jgi:Ca-activated chloride channel family protein